MNPSVSPDGSIRVDYSPNEAGPSRWVFSPRVVVVRTGEILLDLWDPTYWRWDAAASFEGTSLLRLRLRRYPDGTSGDEIVIDVKDRTFSVSAGGHVDELRFALEQMLRPVKTDWFSRPRRAD